MSKIQLPKRFTAFIVTLSLGAFNDNFFKMLLQLYILTIVTARVMTEEMFIFLSTLIFAAPFMIFGPWSGYLADKYAKSYIMKVVKFAEIVIMLFGVMAFYLESSNLMLIMLFLMATQSTFFSPAKYGNIPEICQPQSVSSANGWMEMSTFLSIILGTAITGFLLAFHGNHALTVSFYCVVVAMFGFISSLFIRGKPAAGTNKPFPRNPFTDLVREVVFLKGKKNLFLAALANSYFWLIGLVFQTNILIYGKRMLVGNPNSTILLPLMPAFIGIGIACGSLLASRWSGKKVELGLVPLGGLGIAFAGISLFFTTQSYIAAAVVLFFAGAFGGLYIVPLYAYLQFYAEEHEKGRIMATVGILNGIFMVIGALIYGLFSVTLSVPPETLYLIMGTATIFAVIYICTVIPEYFIRFVFWLLTHTLYRIRIVGEENVPYHGPALLLPNHVTYIDAFIIGSTMQRFIKYMMLKEFYEIPLINKMFKIMKTIPIDPPAGRESVAQSLKAAKEQLLNNHVVCIFPEGKLTRDGKMNQFRPGFETVIAGVDAPIIPVYLDNLWGSIYSFEGGKVIIKWPKSFLRKITVTFGKPMPANATAQEVETAVREMAVTIDD